VLQQFVDNGCGCQRGHQKQPCSTLFTKEHYERVGLECRDLTGKELDLVLLGQMRAGISDVLHNTSEVCRHGVAERQQTSLKFYYRGQSVEYILVAAWYR